MNKLIGFIKGLTKRPTLEQLYDNAGIKPNPLNLDDLITSSGRYPSRRTSSDLTQEVRINLERLLPLVNALLLDLGVTQAKVSSGFRPAAVNAKIPGAAKKSLHMRGLAVDLTDPEGTLAKLLLAKPNLLDKYGLWLENPTHTPGWMHLDLGTRAARPLRIFNP